MLCVKCGAEIADGDEVCGVCGAPVKAAPEAVAEASDTTVVPASETSADASAEEAPAGEASAEETPAEEAPAGEAPAEETPVPEPSTAAKSKKKSRAVITIVIVVVIVLVAFIGLFVISGGSDDSSTSSTSSTSTSADTSSAEAVLEDYTTAFSSMYENYGTADAEDLAYDYFVSYLALLPPEALSISLEANGYDSADDYAATLAASYADSLDSVMEYFDDYVDSYDDVTVSYAFELGDALDEDTLASIEESLAAFGLDYDVTEGYATTMTMTITANVDDVMGLSAGESSIADSGDYGAYVICIDDAWYIWS